VSLATNGQHSAGFGRRFAALIYDALLLAALAMILTACAMMFTHGRPILYESVGAWQYLYRAGLVALVVLYYGFQWRRSGQTLGMRAWRIVVRNKNAAPLSIGQLLRRLTYGALSWGGAGLGVFWIYLDSEGLALHDRLSGTRVWVLGKS
jgi:uncharacterized RDD family membrane protein YckC